MSAWSPLDAFTPFLAAIEGGAQLLVHANALARARDELAFRGAVAALLADLGYEPFVVDETTRLNSQSVLRRLTTVARHGRFVVSMVELAYPQRYATTLDPVFRLHPQGVVFTYSPLFEVSSIVFQPPAASESRPLTQRIIVGKGRSLDVRDNLAVWAWRLAALRPRFGEDVRSLVQRVSENLALRVEAVDRRWSSASEPATPAISGLSWESSLEWCQRGFMEAGARGWCWGLERVMRNQFPICDPQRRWTIRYRGFEVLGDVEVTADALHAEDSRHHRVRLDLVVDDYVAAESHEESIEIGIPVADRYGVFVIDGARARFAPRVGRTGQVLSVGRGDAPDAPLDERSDFNAKEPVCVGIDIGAFLEVAVARKLAGMAANLSRIGVEIPPLGHLRRLFSQAQGGRSLPLLVSRKVMRSTLILCGARDTPSLPALVDGRDGPVEPPAWCCPELTRALPVGQWYPVAGARLTPCGGLALPCEYSGHQIVWRVRDGTALVINPRFGGPPAGPLKWWIAEPLDEFAGCAPGSLPRPLLLARHRPALCELVVARRTGTKLRAAIARRAVAPLAFPVQRLSCAFPVGEVPPRLLVAPGSRIEAGMAWLASAAPPRRLSFAQLMVSLAENSGSEIERRVRKGNKPGQVPSTTIPAPMPVELADEAYWSTAAVLEATALRRVSPGIEGVVIDARVEPIYEWGAQVCWRATLTVQRPEEKALPAVLWLADGTLVNDIEWLDPQDAPPRESGPEVDVVIELPRDADAPEEGLNWRVKHLRHERVLAMMQGEADEELAVHVEDVRVLPGAPARVDGPDWHGRRRARDGECMPTAPDAPGLRADDRLWWALRDPEGHAEVAARESAWSQEVPPWWPSLQETLAAAGLIPDELSSGADGPRQSQQRAPAILHDELRESEGHKAPPRGLWRCACGVLESPTPRFAICVACSKPLRPEPITGVPLLRGWLSAELEILHPWAKLAAAGLVGLSEQEFDRLFAEQPIVDVHAMIRAALADPLAHVTARVAREGELRPDLAGPLALLQALLSSAHPLPIFVELSHLPRLSDALCPLWQVPGSPVPVRNPFTAAYGALEHAIKRLQRLESGWLGPTWVVEEQRREVQRAADRLFGSPSDAPRRGEPRTLADLVARLLPWTRAPGLRSIPPGLVRITGQVDADVVAPDRQTRPAQRILMRPPAFVDFEEAPDATATDSSGTIADMCHSSTLLVQSIELAPHGDAPVRTAVLLERGLRWQPLRPAIAGSWAQPRTWQRRRALAWFMANGVGLLGALGLGSGVPGLSAVSMLLAHLGPNSDICALMGMLTTAWGHRLPDDQAQARASVGEAVSAAFPGVDTALATARTWLVERFIGWWRVPVSLDDPLGWHWSSDEKRPAGRCQRVIPGVRSHAWETLDDWLLLHRPCLWWLRDLSRVDLASWPAAPRILVGVERWPKDQPLAERSDRWDEAHALPARVPLVSLTAPAQPVAPISPGTGSPTLPAPASGRPRLELLHGSLSNWLNKQCRS